jgi:aldose sugar dehydrogenase
MTLIGIGAPLHAAEAPTYRTERATIRVVTIATDLTHPWSLAFLPDARMLVTERPGRMRIVARDGVVGPPLANVPAVFARTQGGLLDVALDRRYAENRTIYFCFSEPAEGGASTAVARARLGDTALESVRVIFRQQPRTGGGYHFGCRIVPAPDGTLFVTLGERFERDRAQDLGTHLGKVVRITTDGAPAPGNPFAKSASARPEIYSYGHRNPQGAALHPSTGRLWIHEHGARGGDEINLPEPGKNYGWPVITYGVDYSFARIGEGTAKPGMEQPVHYWDPSIAPSGMTFYSGERIAGWRGNLFVGALRAQALVRLELDGTKVVREERLLGALGERIRDVREGPDGLLYVLTDSSQGRILRIEPM